VRGKSDMGSQAEQQKEFAGAIYSVLEAFPGSASIQRRPRSDRRKVTEPQRSLAGLIARLTNSADGLEFFDIISLRPLVGRLRSCSKLVFLQVL
jgi:hypothetical protein